MKTPHDYQLAARAHIFARYDAGERRGLLVMPTGTGKTFTSQIIAEEMLRRTGDDFRGLFLVHREELADQSIREFSDLLGADNVGRIQGARSQFGRRMSVAMVQSAAQVKRLHRLMGTRHKLIFIDEAHHGTAESQYGKVLAGLMDESTLLVGLTATPNRADGVGLHEVYDYLHEPITLVEAIARGFLVDLRAKTVPLDLDLSSAIRSGAADFSEQPLGQLMSQPAVVDATVAAWAREALGRPTIGFAVTIEHARRLAERFMAAGVAADFVEQKTPTETRHRMYADLARGSLKVLVSVGILTEGFDERSVSCVLLARPTKSMGLRIQMIGRGLRTHPSKTDCLALDVTGTLHAGGLVTLPMLGGLPADAEEQSEAQREAVERVVKREADGSRGFASLLAVAQAARDVNLLRVPHGRRYQWLEHPKGLVLSLGSPEAGMFVVRKHDPQHDGRSSEGKWRIVHVHRINAPGAVDPAGQWRHHSLAEQRWPDEAIALCEQEAKRFSPPRSNILIGPADPAVFSLAVRDIAARESAINAARGRPIRGASGAASEATLRELVRRGVRLNDAQREALTHGEAEAMLRQGHSAGWRTVRVPERIRGLG